MRILKRILLVLFGLAVVAGIVYASLPKPVEVDLAEVQRGPLRVTVDGDGKTRVQDRHVISAPLYGNLARIELDAGDDVEEGDVLARISPLEPALLDVRSRAELEARARAAQAAKKQAEAAVERASSNERYASRQLARMKSLWAEGIVSETELEAAELEATSAAKALESARFGARVAKYELEMATAALGEGDGRGEEDVERPQLEIRAPVKGRILKIMRESEGVVNPGEPLLELGDPTALEVVVDVLTADAVAISPGDPVFIDRWGGDTPLNGRVRRVEPSAFTKISALGVEEQRVDVVIDLVESAEHWSGLGDNFRVEPHIVVWESDDVIKVPAGALHRHGDTWSVFLVRDGVVEERSVEVGHRSGLEVEILSGVTAGDQVVVHPSDRVRAGIEVVSRG